jgi:hypothetical protein
MPVGQSSTDPVVDPVKTWFEGREPVPTLSEELAASLVPTVPHSVRVITPEDQVRLFGSEAPAPAPDADSVIPQDEYARMLPELDAKIVELAGIPPADLGNPERKAPVLDGLEQFAPPDSDTARVLPQEVAQAYAQDEQELSRSEATGVVLATQVCASGHESPAGAKFCMECGSPFAVAPQAPPQEWTCSSGHLIDWAAKFCMECGDSRPDLKAPVSGAGVAAELAARVPPLDELTPAARAERERQHAAALRAGAADPALVIEKPSGQRPVLVFHVVRSGWTWAGQVWYRGQEIRLEEGTPRWNEAQRFINWTEQEQMERYGSIRWRLGPWPYRQSYAQIEPGSYQKLGSMDGKGQVAPPTDEQLRRADALEQQRGGGVPRPMYR